MPKTTQTNAITNGYMHHAPALLLAMAATAIPTRVLAGDLFEIQVYEAEVNRPWQPGLEAHLNYTMSGRKTPDYAGEQVPHQVGRLTLEPALGITEFLEVGAYLQNTLNADGQYRFAGWKLRTKWVLPKRYTGNFFFGLNAEIGKVPHAVEAEGWANEFRPIAGYYDGHWLFDVNPIIGYALSGPDKLRPEFEPAGKIGFNTQHGFMLGAEYYAGFGYLSSVSTPVSEQEHLLFVTLDLAEAAEAATMTAPAPKDAHTESEPWEFNLGLGRGLTDATPQHYIVKAIFGKAF